MTSQEKLEFIRQKCIEANPEIVELKFGCIVRHTPVKDLGIDYLGVYLHPARGKGMHLIFFEGERTASQQSYSTTVSEKHFEAIGRPIRLADVLLAMGKHPIAEDWKMVGWKREGVARIDYMVAGKAAKSCFWNLRQDDLSKQSEETINFLSTLITP